MLTHDLACAAQHPSHPPSSPLILHPTQVNGSILVARLPEETPSLLQQGEALRSLGIQAEWLDSSALAAQEPSLAAMAGGLRVANDAQLVGGWIGVRVCMMHNWWVGG